jgi:hypothetical protein
MVGRVGVPWGSTCAGRSGGRRDVRDATAYEADRAVGDGRAGPAAPGGGPSRPDGPGEPSGPGGPNDPAELGGAESGRTATTATRVERALPLALTVLVAGVPLAVAAAVLRSPRWYPLLDHAQTELRVRDVGFDHPPLVGLPGRLWGHGESGSHPGPISFWALAPAYRALGSSSWALQAATALLNVVAVGVSLAVARRRSTTSGPVLATGVGLAVLVHAYGPETLTLAWNPYLPVLWWPAFLLAVWAVLDGDAPMLPVAVLAGTFCMQTHLPYLGLVGAVGVVAAVTAGLRVRRHGRGRWLAASAALLVLLWLPPLVDEVANDPGNLSIVGETLRDPLEERVDAGDAARTWLVQLNPVRLATGDHAVGGSNLPGLATLAAWGLAAGAAWRARIQPLVRLHAVAGLALAAGLVATTRITGRVWGYLILWSWGTAALVLLAIAGTAAALAEPHLPDRRRRPAATATATVALATIAALTLASTVDSARYGGPNPGASRAIADLATQTVAALDAPGAPGGGEDGRYLVRWVDPVAPGAIGYALLLELERAGFDATLDEGHATGARPFRVGTPDEASAIVTYVAGPELARWRRDPAAVEVAATGPTAADEDERTRLRGRIADLLRARAAHDLVRVLDVNMMATAADPRTPQDAQDLLDELADVPIESAVFVTPNGHEGPPDGEDATGG